MTALGLSGFLTFFYGLLSYNNRYFGDTEHSPLTGFMLRARLAALGFKCWSICHQMQTHLGLNMGSCAALLTAAQDRLSITDVV